MKMESLTKSSFVRRYFIALLVPALIAGLMQITWPLFEQSPSAPFLLAIMFCGWYGGLGPGLLSILVSILLADYFFIHTYSSLGPQRHHDLIKLLVLATTGVSTSLLSGLTHREKRRAGINLESARQADEAVREAQQKYRDIFDNAVEGIFQTSPSGGFIDGNPALARMLGYESPEEMIQARGSGTQQRYHDPARHDEFTRLLQEHGVVRDFEYVEFRKDGSRIFVSDNVRTVRDRDGKLRYYEGTTQDITERKQAEEALRESEERYRELFENAKDATYVHDLKGRYISVNRAAEKLSGHTRDEIIGRRFSDFIPLEEVGAVSERLCQKLIDEGETSYQTEVIASDGRRVPVEVSSHLIYENGIAIAVQGTARDVTERLRAEDRLREYEKVVEGLEEMIVVVDRDFRYLLANRAFLKYRGMTRAELLGRLIPEVLDQNVFDGLVRQKLELTFQGQVVRYEMKYSYPHLGERDLLISYLPIHGPAGIDRVACVLQDITERKLAEEALRQSEERFSKAFHSSPASLSIAQLIDGRLLEVNAAFLRMTGYTREDVIGRSTLEIGLWADPDYRLMMTEKLRDSRAVDNLNFKFRKKSGELRDGLLSVELIELGAEPCILGIALDTTERLRAEEAQQSYPRRLIEAQETERQTIARELHDQIGQVLTAIRINLQTVWETCESSESRALIDEGVAIVDAAVAQVRDLSFDLRPSLLDDLGLVVALRWYSDRFARRTGIHSATTIDLPENTRLRLELETACFRIVQEALTNVVRHAKARNVSITLRSLDNELTLFIKDDGRGFDAHAHNQSEFTTSLGLRGMRERALALGGRLEIKSSPSRGTEIRAHFPGRSRKN